MAGILKLQTKFEVGIVPFENKNGKFHFNKQINSIYPSTTGYNLMPGQFIIVIWVHWTFNTKPWTSPCRKIHYTDVIMSDMASQITSLKIVYSTDHSDADQRKDQRSASLALVRGIHRWPVNSPLKVQATLKMFPFDDVITLKKLFCWSLLLFMSQDSTKQSPLFSPRRSCLLSLWWR